jgi:hypothetical protein
MHRSPLALVILALSSCFSWGRTDTTAERGKAGARVQVVNTDGRPLGATAEAVDWRPEPHPQGPFEGGRAHFRFRFDGAEVCPDPAADACAVDKKRVALGCRVFYSFQAFGPADDPLRGPNNGVERDGG